MGAVSMIQGASSWVPKIRRKKTLQLEHSLVTVRMFMYAVLNVQNIFLNIQNIFLNIQNIFLNEHSVAYCQRVYFYR